MNGFVGEWFRRRTVNIVLTDASEEAADVQPHLQPEPLDHVGGDDAEGYSEAVGDRRDEVHPLPGLVVVLRRHLQPKYRNNRNNRSLNL